MIAVDWGSTRLRAFRLDALGVVREVRRSDEGVSTAEGRFAEVLARCLQGWDDALVVMAGMVGSRQGWQEVDYVDCPADVGAVAARLQPLRDEGFDGRALWLVPGLRTRDDDGVADVMRGEESQLFGVAPALGQGRHYVCLPGTHSKHAWIEDGRVLGFSTFMTGEAFELWRTRSVLSRSMSGERFDEGAFAAGLADASRGGGLLHQLFGLRTRALFDELPADLAPSHLSGLLIGHELHALPAECTHVHVVAGDALADAYLVALRLRGIEATRHADDAAATGMWRLARARGLVG